MKTFNYLTNMPEMKSLAVEEINGSRYYISPNR